jgi:hypothetical protein
MHGLHEVDQKDSIVGFPSLTRRDVSKLSPLEFSTITEGTCADARAEIRIATLRRKVLILILI